MFNKQTLLLLAIAVLFVAGCTEKPEKEKKALFIILDGISADVLEMVDTPNLDEVVSEGSYTRAYLGGEEGGYSESPTVSAVGYIHVLTGVWSNKHNVYGNNIEDPNYHYWNIFRLLKHNAPDKTAAIYSSWLDNRTKLVGDGLEEAGGINIDIHVDGFELDTLAFPHVEGEKHVQDIDHHVSESAALSIREDGPDLSWVYLWYTDSAGHLYGDGEEYYQALRTADQQIGRIWEAIKYREENFNEEWLFVITTDHGRSLPDGKGHGGHTERERTVWIVTNEKDTNLYFTASRPAIVDIYPTISRHMNFDLPEQLEKELDGVPLIGHISVSHPAAELDAESNEISIGWKAWHEEGNVKVWLTRTNEFQNGGEDEYELIKEVPLISGQTTIDVSGLPSDFYKIVLEGPYNSVNRWVVSD